MKKHIEEAMAVAGIPPFTVGKSLLKTPAVYDKHSNFVCDCTSLETCHAVAHCLNEVQKLLDLLTQCTVLMEYAGGFWDTVALCTEAIESASNVEAPE